jgi:hypothetical protein
LTFRVGGVPYGVQGSGVRCNSMRFWTHRWLTRGGEPRHWSCVDLGDGGDCHRRGGGAKFEYYAYD